MVIILHILRGVHSQQLKYLRTHAVVYHRHHGIINETCHLLFLVVVDLFPSK
jgi:hypothetical protein